jgi:hypothetical protein
MGFDEAFEKIGWNLAIAEQNIKEIIWMKWQEIGLTFYRKKILKRSE